MIVLKKLSPSAEARFAERGIDTGKALLTMRADLGEDAVMCDVYAVLLEDRLCVLEGSAVIRRPSGMVFADARDREQLFEEKRYAEFELSRLEKLHVETMISSAAVVAEYDGTEREIFRLTNTCKHDANVLCSVFEELKKNGKIDEKKFEKETQDNHFCPKCGMRYPDIERRICPRCMDKARLIKRLGVMFVRYKGYIAMILFTFAMITALGVLTPYVSNTVFYDEVLTEGGAYYGEIGKIVLLIVGVRIVSLIVSLVNGIISAKVAAELVYDLKKMIFLSLIHISEPTRRS